MQTHQAKRVEITIEAVMQSRLCDALIEAGVTGFTVSRGVSFRRMLRALSERRERAIRQR